MIKSININSIYSYYLPYIIFILIIFNQFLSSFGINYLYAVFIIISIVGMFASGFKSLQNSKYIVIYAYIFSLFLLFLIQTFIYDNIENSIRSLLMYILIIIYWSVFFTKYGVLELKYLIERLTLLVYIVAIFGVIQYFYSPNLFGLLDNVSKGIEWAKNLSFIEYAIFFRASSILGSSQVYGLFMALSIIMIIEVSNKKVFKLGIVFLVFSGLLSGDKSFVVILLLYAIYTFLKTKILTKFYTIISVMLLFLILNQVIPSNTFTNFRILDRITSSEKIIKQENEDSRLSRYKNILLNSNTLLGDGLGSRTSHGDNIKVAESYLLQIYAELGIFAFVSFLLFLLVSLKYAKKNLFYNIHIFILLVMFSMLIVHAFNSPIFFIVWGILISSYTNIVKRI